MNATKSARRLGRRHFLRGASGLIALPWLTSLARGDLRPGFGSTPPQRFAFVYTPNGYNQSTFIPSSGHPDGPLPAALQPLEGLRDRVTLLTGLDRRFVPGTGVHAQCGSCWLTSSAPEETLDGGFPTNRTLDQMLASRIGQATPLPSLELSCNDFTNRKETKYFESISWYGPGHAATTEKNPRTVFRRLFGQPEGNAISRSVLDQIHEDARRMQSRLSQVDRRKLDEYLEGVRATERRIQLAESAARRTTGPAMDEPAGIPEDRGEYIRLMGELIVHAFHLDMTRVATLVIDPERWDSPRMFDGVFDAPQNHHVLTHTKGDEAKEKITKIDRFHVQQFAYVVGRLAEIDEGDASLLDRTTLVMGSGISDGDRHNYADLQILYAGGGLRRAGHIDYPGHRPLADFWLTLLQRGGVAAKRFADSTGVLTELA